ncbi:MAG: zinc ribbon domain-containing protein [Myxococcaceae bacterium]|nr:zinc ribbon domain-containing protein [Myxococcaceae bacterium]
MTIEFTCQKCEGTFEIDMQELIDGTEPLECPHCGNKVSKALGEDFNAALAELQAQLTALSKKFTLTMELDSEELSSVAEEEAEADEDDDEEDDDSDDEDDDEDDDDDDDDEELIEDGDDD